MEDDGIVTCAVVTDYQSVCSFIRTTVIRVHGGIVNSDSYIDTIIIHNCMTGVGCTTIQANGSMFNINL